MRYDVYFLPCWDADLAFAPLAAYLSGARERIGFSEHVNPLKEYKNRGYDALLTRAVMAPPYLVHEVQKMTFLLRAVGLCAESEHLACWVADVAKAARTLLGETVQGGMAHAD